MSLIGAQVRLIGEALGRVSKGAVLLVVQEISYEKTKMYRLRWPTGMTTWHLREEFDQVRNPS